MRAACGQELLFDHAINQGFKYGEAAVGFGEGRGVFVQIYEFGPEHDLKMSGMRQCKSDISTPGGDQASDGIAAGC